MSIPSNRPPIPSAHSCRRRTRKLLQRRPSEPLIEQPNADAPSFFSNPITIIKCKSMMILYIPDRKRRICTFPSTQMSATRASVSRIKASACKGAVLGTVWKMDTCACCYFRKEMDRKWVDGSTSCAYHPHFVSEKVSANRRAPPNIVEAAANLPAAGFEIDHRRKPTRLVADGKRFVAVGSAWTDRHVRC